MGNPNAIPCTALCVKEMFVHRDLNVSSLVDMRTLNLCFRTCKEWHKYLSGKHFLLGMLFSSLQAELSKFEDSNESKLGLYWNKAAQKILDRLNRRDPLSLSQKLKETINFLDQLAHTPITWHGANDEEQFVNFGRVLAGGWVHVQADEWQNSWVGPKTSWCRLECEKLERASVLRQSMIQWEGRYNVRMGAISPYNDGLVVQVADDKIYVYTIDGKFVHLWHPAYISSVTAVIWGPERKIFVATHTFAKLIICDTEDKSAKIHDLKEVKASERITSLAFSSVSVCMCAQCTVVLKKQPLVLISMRLWRRSIVIPKNGFGPKKIVWPCTITLSTASKGLV